MFEHPGSRSPPPQMKLDFGYLPREGAGMYPGGFGGTLIFSKKPI